jgi:hypothetical protein
MFDEARGDRPGLDQRDLDPGPLKLKAQRVRHRLHREFRGAISAAIGRRHQPEHRGAEHDAALALPAHGRNDAGREVVPTEHIRLELRPEGFAAVVFECAGLPIGAIVEEHEEAAFRLGQHLFGCGGD